MVEEKPKIEVCVCVCERVVGFGFFFIIKLCRFSFYVTFTFWDIYTGGRLQHTFFSSFHFCNQPNRFHLAPSVKKNHFKSFLLVFFSSIISSSMWLFVLFSCGVYQFHKMKQKNKTKQNKTKQNLIKDSG